MNVYSITKMQSVLLISKGNKPRKGTVTNCLWCNEEVYKCPSRAKLYNKQTFCCKEHNTLYMKANAFNFKCTVCDKIKFTQPYQMKIREAPTCSIKCRSQLVRIKAIERRTVYTKHQIDRLQRYSPENKQWRIETFKRDNYTCQICGVRGTNLEADHIWPWAYFEESRFDLNNGRTLCKPCHQETKTSAKAMRLFYTEAVVEKMKASRHISLKLDRHWYTAEIEKYRLLVNQLSPQPKDILNCT